MTDGLLFPQNMVFDGSEITPECEIIESVPVDFPAPNLLLEGRELEATYEYKHADGTRACYVARYTDRNRGKIFRPVTLWRNRHGDLMWHFKGLQSPRPLFNLVELSQRSDTPVLLCEGEKCAMAASKAFPGYVATTWMNGAQAIRKTDFTPLTGRKAIILPDNDEPGQRAAEGLEQILAEVGAQEVVCVKPEALALQVSATCSPGWDIADAIDAGFTVGHLEQALAANVPTPKDDEECPLAIFQEMLDEPGLQSRDNETDIAESTEASEHNWLADAFLTFGVQAALHGDFEARPEGIVKHDLDRNREPITIFACSPVVILGRTVVGEAGCDWGFLIGHRNPRGDWDATVVPARLLAGDGRELRELLGSKGVRLPMDRPGRQALSEYIGWGEHERIVEIANQPGWHKGSFALPHHVITRPGVPSDVILDMGGRNHFLKKGGTAKGWARLASLAERNSRAAFVICMALAAPLLRPLDHLGGGVHLYGQSSRGKTTLLTVAGSVWGGGGKDGFARGWRMTTNGAEGLIADHNDLLLPLDELTTVTPEQAEDLYYLLANGQGKARAQKDGTSQASVQWRSMVLSSGEHKAEQQLQSGRGTKRITGGLAVRMVDVPLEYEEGQSFEDLGECETPGQCADLMTHLAKSHFGHAGPTFVAYFLQNEEGHLAQVTETAKRVFRHLIQDDDDPQVQRVAKRFAIIAAAGHLAVAGGILDWNPDNVDLAVSSCFTAWRSQRGGGESEERRNALKHLRWFFEVHGPSRFERLILDTADDDQPDVSRSDDFAVRDRCGYRLTQADGGQLYYVLSHAWEREVCGDHNPDLLLKIAGDLGALVLGEGGRKKKKIRLPDFPNGVRLVAIRPHLLG